MKLLAIMGESGSGKNYIRDQVIKCDMQNIFYPTVRTTTRPIRSGEIPDITYHYIDGEEYGSQFINMEFIEVNTFRDWFYGTNKKDLHPDKINIACFDPGAIEQMWERLDIDLKVIYLQASDKTRLMRSLSREDNPDVEEIIRRYHADKEDFLDITFDYYSFKNESIEDAEYIVEYILSLGQKWANQ